ncbi:MAG: hypothetical protein IME94_01015 [Proteobacteria bacterium]|nr:hypothetical protein [Pseudomonadota bacterium]
MFKSACDVMKKVVIVSASLLLTGAILEVLAQLMTTESMVPIFFAYAGVFAIGTGIVVLLGVFVAMMIPSISQKLDTCQH